MKKLGLLVIFLLMILRSLAFNPPIDDTLHHLYGAIAGKYGITMNIFIRGSQVSGSMYYNRVGKYIYLNGTIDGAGHMQLVGSLENGQKTDFFDGRYDGKIFQGTWRSPQNNRTLTFKLSRTNKHWVLLDSAIINIKDSIKVSDQWVYFIDTEHIVYPKAYPIARVARKIDSIVRTYVFANDLIGIDIYESAKITGFKQYYNLIHKALVDWKEYELRESYDFPTNNELYKNVYTDYLGHLLMRIKVNGYAYTGGAHGYSFDNVKIIDLYTGNSLSWSDVFKIPESTFLHKVLIPVMRDYFKKEYNLKLENVIWDFSDLEIFEFNIVKNGIYFTISQDQFSIDNELMPMPDFFISFDKLKPYLSDFIKHRLELD